MDEDPEGYAITTSHLPDTTTSVDCPECSSPWVWIILFVVFLLLAIGLGIWIIYLIRRDNKNCSGCTGPGVPIAFENPAISVDSDTQITGTWTTTDPGDIVTLFATLNPPKFNSSGGLDNATAATNFKVAGSTVFGTTGNTGNTGPTGINAGVNSVTLSGLTPGVKYYATLIARNSNTNNYKSYTQIVYMQDGNIPMNVAGSTGASVLNTFEIQNVLQVGAIQIRQDTADANGIFNVEFNQRPTQSRDLFYFNGSSQLQSSTSGLENVCLFNSSGNLVAAPCAGMTGAVPGSNANNSYWQYNPPGQANKLCLKNYVNTSTPLCLKLTGIGQGTGTLSLSSDLSPGDAWAPVFTEQ